MKSNSFDIDSGKRLKIVRKHLNMWQPDFAELCEISQPLLSQIENGNREMQFNILRILYLKHNINPNYLILGGDNSIEYKKNIKNTESNLNELRADMEILKAEITLLKQKCVI